MIKAIARLFGFQASAIDTIYREYGVGMTHAGMRVGVDEFLSYSPVWQAVRMIAGDVAKTQRNMYRRMPELGATASEMVSTPAGKLVSRSPNSTQSAFRFWNDTVFSLLMWHNAYAWIERNPTNGQPVGLYPLRPDRTKWSDEDGVYVSEIGFGNDTEVVAFQRENVLHFRGFSTPSGEPSFLRNARESIAASLAAQKHLSKFLSQDCIAGGLLEVPASFSKKAKDNLQQGFQKKHKNDPFQTVILRDGAKFHQIQIDAEKSQLTETRIWQAREVAMWFNMPASKLSIPDSGGYGSRTEDNQNYFHQTIDPLETEIEGELNLKLLTSSQKRQDSHFFSHDDFVKLDRKTKADIYKIEYEGSASSPDEYRAWIGKNPRPDGRGNMFVEPNANHLVADSDDEPSSDSGQENETAQAVVAEIRKQSTKKDEKRFLRWLDDFADSEKVRLAEKSGLNFGLLKTAIEANISNLEEILKNV